MRKRSSPILVAGMIFPVLAAIVACDFKSQHPNANSAEIPSARVAAAMRGNIAHTLSLAGQFQPYQVVDVHPKVTGFMVKINVDIGDRVHKGETLAVLEVPELNAQLKGRRSTPAPFNTTSCASMDNGRSTCRFSNRAETATPSPS